MLTKCHLIVFYIHGLYKWMHILQPIIAIPGWKDILREAIIIANETGNILFYCSRNTDTCFLSLGKNGKTLSHFTSEWVSWRFWEGSVLNNPKLSKPSSAPFEWRGWTQHCQGSRRWWMGTWESLLLWALGSKLCQAKMGEDERGKTDSSLVIKMQFI